MSDQRKLYVVEALKENNKWYPTMLVKFTRQEGRDELFYIKKVGCEYKYRLTVYVPKEEK